MHSFVCFSVTRPPGPTEQFTNFSMQSSLYCLDTLGLENKHAVAIRLITASIYSPLPGYLEPSNHHMAAPRSANISFSMEEMWRIM